MGWPLVALAVPTALLGFFAFPGSGLGRALGLPNDNLVGLSPITLGVLFLTGVGILAAWRGQVDVDPARSLGPLRPVLEKGFYFDVVQDFLVVRPTYALARWVKSFDTRVVDGAVEGIGSGSSRLAGLVNRLHAPGLPRYVTATLSGVLLIAVAALATEALR
jgi:NADH-quinone oxidoreductase subunit L